MFPIGELDRLETFLSRNAAKSPTGTYTFGVLVVDQREKLNRELVLSCLNEYDDYSAENFDFYIPGYSDYWYGDYVDAGFSVKGKPYYYSKSSFLKFKRYLESVFAITIGHTPELILVSVKNDNFTINSDNLKNHISKYYVYDFSKNRESIEASNRFFLDVFDVVKKYDVLSRSSGLDRTYLVKGDYLDAMIKRINKYAPYLVKLIFSFGIDA